MNSHLDQLKPLLEKNKDILHVVQVGMIGAWGEWHSYSDSGDYAIDEAALVRKVLQTVPGGGVRPNPLAAVQEPHSRRRPAV